MEKDKSLTGLQIMQMILEGKLPAPSITETMPMKAIEASHGYVKFTATADKRHLNPYGGIHGGFAATVLDSVTGCAAHTVLDENTTYATIELNIKYVRPLPKDRELIAEGRVINSSKSLIISEGRIFDENGKLYALATATFMILH